jgi:Lecithin retinol acyltransferase
VQRALSRVGERGYSLTGNNCEHFATWCATGIAVSQQVIAWLKSLLQIALAVTGTLLLVALTQPAPVQAD